MGKALAVVVVGLLALGVASCGGDDSPTPAPTPTPAPAPAPNPTPNPSPATITITSAGVSPRTVTIAAGGRVTFVNNDSRMHDMASDPHPEHTNCPALNQVGFLQPTQSGTSGNLTTARTCGFHDHIRATDSSLQGTVVVQ